MPDLEGAIAGLQQAIGALTQSPPAETPPAEAPPAETPPAETPPEAPQTLTMEQVNQMFAERDQRIADQLQGIVDSIPQPVPAAASITPPPSNDNPATLEQEILAMSGPELMKPENQPKIKQWQQEKAAAARAS